MRLIDLSVAIENGLPVDRPGNGPKIRYQNHQETFEALAKPFAGLRPEDLPDGEAWAVERLDLSTHNGTHMDAPWHYASTMNRGERAATIDEVPLDWCYRPGVSWTSGTCRTAMWYVPGRSRMNWRASTMTCNPWTSCW